MKTAQILISEFNQIRKQQKNISQFNSVADWLAYGIEIAKQKASLLKQIEQINK